MMEARCVGRSDVLCRRVVWTAAAVLVFSGAGGFSQELCHTRCLDGSCAPCHDTTSGATVTQTPDSKVTAPTIVTTGVHVEQTPAPSGATAADPNSPAADPNSPADDPTSVDPNSASDLSMFDHSGVAASTSFLDESGWLSFADGGGGGVESTATTSASTSSITHGTASGSTAAEDTPPPRPNSPSTTRPTLPPSRLDDPHTASDTLSGDPLSPGAGSDPGTDHTGWGNLLHTAPAVFGSTGTDAVPPSGSPTQPPEAATTPGQEFSIFGLMIPESDLESSVPGTGPDRKSPVSSASRSNVTDGLVLPDDSNRSEGVGPLGSGRPGQPGLSGPEDSNSMDPGHSSDSGFQAPTGLGAWFPSADEKVDAVRKESNSSGQDGMDDLQIVLFVAPCVGAVFAAIGAACVIRCATANRRQRHKILRDIEKRRKREDEAWQQNQQQLQEQQRQQNEVREETETDAHQQRHTSSRKARSHRQHRASRPHRSPVPFTYT